MIRRKWAILAGAIAALACAWALFVWIAAPYLPSIAAMRPGPVLLGLVAAIPLSIFAGICWRRVFWGITVVATVMLIYIGFRLH